MLSPKGNYEISYVEHNNVWAREWEVRVVDLRTGSGRVAYCGLYNPYLRATLAEMMMDSEEYER